MRRRRYYNYYNTDVEDSDDDSKFSPPTSSGSGTDSDSDMAPIEAQELLHLQEDQEEESNLRAPPPMQHYQNQPNNPSLTSEIPRSRLALGQPSFAPTNNNLSRLQRAHLMLSGNIPFTPSNPPLRRQPPLLVLTNVPDIPDTPRDVDILLLSPPLYNHTQSPPLYIQPFRPPSPPPLYTQPLRPPSPYIPFRPRSRTTMDSSMSLDPDIIMLSNRTGDDEDVSPHIPIFLRSASRESIPLSTSLTHIFNPISKVSSSLAEDVRVIIMNLLLNIETVIQELKTRIYND